MPGTKIINVLKDDRFEDIINIFRKTPAQEVIFVLPKKCQILNNQEHFALLAEESQENDKNILILTADTNVRDLALEHGLGVLTSDDNQPRQKQVKLSSSPENFEANQIFQKADEGEPETVEDNKFKNDQVEDDQLEDSVVEEKEEVDNWENEGGTLSYEDDKPYFQDESVQGESEAELTAIKRESKIVNDILKPSEEGLRVKISKKTEKPISLGLNKQASIDDEIQSVWQSRNETWKIPPRRSYRPNSGNFIRNFFSSFKPLFFNFSKRTTLVFGILAALLLGVVIYVSAGKAQIIIKPRAHILDFSLKVNAADSFSSVDVDLKKIPGQLFVVNKTVEEVFPATGERDVVQKARGKIKVFNEYGTTPQVLIATTRFQSESGLVFRTLKTVTVPGTKVENGKITPGSVEIEVIADKAGSDYNIDPGKFTIPAFKEKGDNDRYQKFYGISSEPIKGGIVGKAKVITEQDYLNGKKKVEEKIKKEIEDELKNQASGLKIIKAIDSSLPEISSNSSIDEAADDFKVIGKANAQTVAFKESDFNDLIILYIGKTNDLETFPNKLNIKFENISFDQNTKVLGFTAAVKGSAYTKVNKDMIISDLTGKNEDKIKEYIKNNDNISSARVILSPFWVFKVPTDKERISLELLYE